MKLKVTIALVITLLVYRPAHSQVWYPEGVFIHNEPVMIRVDNQVITISRAGSDALNSFWRVCTYDGKTWNRLPLLVLNKTAEISDIEQFQGLIYISGNFTYENASSNALVRFNPLTGKWQGVAIFQKASLFASIACMDVQNLQLVLGG